MKYLINVSMSKWKQLTNKIVSNKIFLIKGEKANQIQVTKA